MNKVTRDIMAILKCDAERALNIQIYLMEHDGLDFSECTQREFVKAVREADAELAK